MKGISNWYNCKDLKINNAKVNIHELTLRVPPGHCGEGWGRRSRACCHSSLVLSIAVVLADLVDVADQVVHLCQDSPQVRSPVLGPPGRTGGAQSGQHSNSRCQELLEVAKESFCCILCRLVPRALKNC